MDGSPWSAITARAEAQKLLHQAGLGIDPRDVAKKTTRAQVDLRFDDFATRFLDLYAKIEWAPRTYDTHESNIRRWLLPVFRSTPIRTLTRKDVTNVLDRISPRKPALQRNVFVLLRKMLNWAVERGEIPASPMAGMKTPRGAPERHHILADHEFLGDRLALHDVIIEIQ